MHAANSPGSFLLLFLPLSKPEAPFRANTTKLDSTQPATALREVHKRGLASSSFWSTKGGVVFCSYVGMTSFLSPLSSSFSSTHLAETFALKASFLSSRRLSFSLRDMNHEMDKKRKEKQELKILKTRH